MFHKKRFRSAIALILTLLLTVALASVAAAQDDVGPGTPTTAGAAGHQYAGHRYAGPA